jgi:hypothetical protein
MIVGRVRVAGTGHPTGNVIARWQATYNNGSPVTTENDVGRAVAVNGAEQHVDLDDQGHFVVCGVARGRPIHLRYAEKERFADTTVIVGDTLLHPVQWRPILPPLGSNPLDASGVEPEGPNGEPLDVSRRAREQRRRDSGPPAERRGKPAAR